MANQTTLILLVVAGALCIVASALFAVVAWINFSRAKAPAPKAPTARRAMDQAQFDEEEMPTVVVNQPLPGRGPAAPAPPAGRTSGATIIAFDEEEEDGM